MTQILTVGDTRLGRAASPAKGRPLEQALDWPMLCFAAIVSSVTLFAYQLNSLTVVFSSLALVFLLFYRAKAVGRSITGSWLLPLFLFWMLLSAVWSQYPGTTIYYGVEAGVTLLIGLLLGHGSRHDETLLGLFLGWSLYTLGSLVFGHSVQWGSHGGSAFSGLNEGKNYAGDTAVLGFIFALHAIRWSWARNRMGLLAYAVFVALADLAIVGMAQSSGAILGVGEVIILFMAMSLFMILPLTMRTSVLIVMVVSGAILFLARDIWLDPLRGAVLTFFGKDPTLTGRLYLWVRADEIMQSHPWLGVGYNGFWVQGNLDAEGLWRSEGIIGRSGFNFHNSVIEMRVHLGWIGLAIVSTVVALYSLRLLKGFALAPTIAGMTWLIVLLYEFGRMPYESISIAPFSYATMVLVGAMASGGSRLRA